MRRLNCDEVTQIIMKVVRLDSYENFVGKLVFNALGNF